MSVFVGNVTTDTIEFNDPQVAFVTISKAGIANTTPVHTLDIGSNVCIDDSSPNVVTVRGGVIASSFAGDGSLLTNVVMTANLQEVSNLGNVTNIPIEFINAETAFTTFANVGIANISPIHTLDIGSNIYIDDIGSNVLFVNGNVLTIGNIFTTGNITADYFYGEGSQLTNVTANTTFTSTTFYGNSTPYTVEFLNAETSFITTGNVGISNILPTDALDVGSKFRVSSVSGNVLVVDGTIVASRFIGDGNGVMNVITAMSLAQVVDNGNVTSNTVMFANNQTAFVTYSNVGICNTDPIHNLDVGSNLYIQDDAGVDEILSVTGNVRAYYYKGDGRYLSNIPACSICSTLDRVTNIGNTTSNTVRFVENTTSLITLSNVGIANEFPIHTVDIGANIYMDDDEETTIWTSGNIICNYIIGDGSKLYNLSINLQDVVNNGNVTTNIVFLSNTIESLVVESNIKSNGDCIIDSPVLSSIMIGGVKPTGPIHSPGLSNVQRISIGFESGQDGQYERAIAMGYRAGNQGQGTQAVAIGTRAGENIQGDYALAMGYEAGVISQNAYATAIGYQAGSNSQAMYATAIGSNAGSCYQQSNATAIGENAGYSNQGTTALAIGSMAGAYDQSGYSVAVGGSAGLLEQGSNSIAIGYESGMNYQAANTLSIGYQAGQFSQNSVSVSLGYQAGQSYQDANALAIGYQAGQSFQNSHSISLGYQAGQSYQNTIAFSIGYQAGQSFQNSNAFAMGYQAGQFSQNSYSIALGTQTGQSYQDVYSMAIGHQAGQELQDSNAFAMGYQAGQVSQNSYSVALGTQSGQSYQNVYSMAIGYQAGQELQDSNAFAMGYQAGQLSQNIYSIALGTQSGQSYQNVYSMAIGYQAGQQLQDSNAFAMGYQAGQLSQNVYAVALGTQAGQSYQNTHSFAIGYQAGQHLQDSNAHALGYQAGQLSQNVNSFALGTQAGQSYQNVNSISIGYQAGQSFQGANAFAVGTRAGQISQNAFSVALGSLSGQSYQGVNSISVGNEAARNLQGANAIALGYQSGRLNQGQEAISIGMQAGEVSQGLRSVSFGSKAGVSGQNAYSVSVGYQSGMLGQEVYSTAVGSNSGSSNQGPHAVAIGYGAGLRNQQANAIAIGCETAAVGQGDKSIAIGYKANSTTANSISIGANSHITTSNTILFNASGQTLNPSRADGLYIKPINRLYSPPFSTVLSYTSDNEIISLENFTYTAEGNIYINSNLIVNGDFGVISSNSFIVDDNIILIANNNTTGALDMGFVMSRVGSNVAIGYQETSDEFFIAYTTDPANQSTFSGITTENLKVHLYGPLEVKGNVSSAFDTDAYSYLGRAKVGYVGHADYAGFSHLDSDQYALLQSSGGTTYINTKSGQSIRFRADNVDMGRFDTLGNFYVSNTVQIGRDLDLTSYVNKAAIGVSAHSDNASFSQIDNNTGVAYALRQDAAGTTYINSKSGQDIKFRDNDVDIVTVDERGIVLHAPARISTDGGPLLEGNLLLSNHLSYVTGTTFDGSVDRMIQTDATSSATAGTLVARDAEGDTNFANMYASSNIGIGTTSPQQKLHVEGGCIRLSSGANYAEICLTTLNSSPAIGIYNQLVVNGNIFSTDTLMATEVLATSDIRLKSNITKIDNPLEKIEKLNGYTFEMNGSQHTGMIAQEVLDVLPEAVGFSPNGYYTLAYGNLVGLLVEGVKELNKELKDMNKEITSLWNP